MYTNKYSTNQLVLFFQWHFALSQYYLFTCCHGHTKTHNTNDLFPRDTEYDRKYWQDTCLLNECDNNNEIVFYATMTLILCFLFIFYWYYVDNSSNCHAFAGIDRWQKCRPLFPSRHFGWSRALSGQSQLLPPGSSPHRAANV